ncbi:MAG: response regulator [Chloroflexi bacterium]|nr:response regulator [Chloroflexota bacterium]
MARRPRIAIIDDDPAFVGLMHDLLSLGESYEVISTSDWLSSLEFVRTENPDLVILDLMLGRDQSGAAILELLREDPRTTSVPVLVCSAAAPALLRQASVWRDRGVVETLAKPFDVDDMLQAIERLLHSTATSAA